MGDRKKGTSYTLSLSMVLVCGLRVLNVVRYFCVDNSTHDYSSGRAVLCVVVMFVFECSGVCCVVWRIDFYSLVE